MTERPAEVPTWVQPYLPDFRELLRRLDLTPGFSLQPVVLPSPDLARALADWLSAQGVDVRVFDMRSESWGDLASRLLSVTFDPAAERRAVVVITPNTLDRVALAEGLAALNFSRDSIAQTLQCPLLWCGDVELLRVTAEFATDFWSIAGMVYRLPLRALSDVPPGLEALRLWWTGAARRNTDDIAAALDLARTRGDKCSAAQFSLDLAEAQLALGHASEAKQTLAEIEADILAVGPSLHARWHALSHAVRARSTSASDTNANLRARIANAQSHGAIAIEASLHEELAHALPAQAGDIDEVFEALLAARALYLRAGDEHAALRVEWRLVQLLSRLSPEVITEIRVHAERVTHKTAPSRIRAIAWSILARLAYQEQRWGDAEVAASAMLRDLDPTAPERVSALFLCHDLAARRGDCAARLAYISELIELAQSHHLHPLAVSAYRLRAYSHWELGHHKDASRDIRAARELAAALGDRDGELCDTIFFAQAAQNLGATEVYAALLPRSLELRIRARSSLPGAAAFVGSADPDLTKILEGCTDDRGSQGRTIAQLKALADAREQALHDRGIDLFDVDTWPVKSAQDLGHQSSKDIP